MTGVRVPWAIKNPQGRTANTDDRSARSETPCRLGRGVQAPGDTPGVSPLSPQAFISDLCCLRSSKGRTANADGLIPFVINSLDNVMMY